jgi:hypothetical protein
MKTQIPLKELPPQPKKGKIYEMYGRQFSTSTIRGNLNTLIDDFKKQTNMIVNSRDVPRPVWLEFLNTFGFPFGYEQKPEWLEEPTIFNKK